MNLKTLLFSFEGRIGRAAYWLTIVPLIIVVQIVAYAPLLVVNTESDEMPASFMVAMLAMQLIWLACLWPLLAVGSKRLHDRNKRGWWLVIFWVLPFLLFFGGFGYDFTSVPAAAQEQGYFTTGMKMIYSSFAVAVWGIVELGFLPGDKGPNQFGDASTQQRATSPLTK